MGPFDSIQFDEQSKHFDDTFKETFEILHVQMLQLLKPGRAASLANTKIDEAFMWVRKAIRDDQLAREKEAGEAKKEG